METVLLLGLVLTAAISVPTSIAALVVAAHLASRLRSLEQRERRSSDPSSRIEIDDADREPDGRISIEERLGARGFVWLGALALAVAGAFLVDHSVTAGWLGPTARVGLAIVLGFALVAAGLTSTRRAPRVAPALCAAGVADLFACWLAMGELYEWIPQTTALALATVTSAGAMWLAIRAGVAVGWAAALSGAAFVASWAFSSVPHPAEVGLACAVVGAPVATASFWLARRPERATPWSLLASVTTLLFYLVALGPPLATGWRDLGGFALAAVALALGIGFGLARLPVRARDWPFGAALGLAAVAVALAFDPAPRAAVLCALVPGAISLGTRLDVRATSAFSAAIALAAFSCAALVAAHAVLEGSPAGSRAVGLGTPWITFALAARLAVRSPRGEPRFANALAVASALSLLVWLTVEIRVALHGTDAEPWAYSIAWALYGGAVLLAGILRASRPLRLTSLAIVLVAVAKVSLLDTASLAGLWRVAALLTLGATLIALSVLYQRLLFPPRRRARDPHTS